MPNQQLLDFIKNSKATGQTDEQIKSALKQSGWQDAEIEESFNSLMTSPPAQNFSDSLYGNKQGNIVITPEGGFNKKLIFAVVIILILLVGGAAAYFYKDNLSNLLVVGGFITKQTPAKNSTTQTIDCGTSNNYQKMDCFINALQSCAPAKILLNGEFALFAMTSSWTTLYEIQGRQVGKCIVYAKGLDGNLKYSQDYIQNLLNSGKTMAQVQDLEQKSLKDVQTLIGRDGTCSLTDTSGLINYFKKHQQGSYISTSENADLINMGCKGEFFGQPGQPANTSKKITGQQCNDQNGYEGAITDTGTACFKNQTDLGTITDTGTLNGNYPQCCTKY